MKLKYYLRGLGTGIIFTAIVLMIIYSYRTTDSKIMDRARELGMVMSGENANQTTEEESSENKEQDTTNAESDAEDTTVDNTTAASEQGMDNTTASESAAEDTTTETKNEEHATEETTIPQESDKENTTSAEENTDETTTEKQTLSGNEVTFTITSGMYSEIVSQKLYELGVVDDATAFNLYLVQNGYAARIRTGTYTFTTGMSYEDVAAIISR